MPRLSAPPAAAARSGGERLVEEERRLYERVLRRDASALLECVDRFGDLVYCVALARTGAQTSAEGLTEALFVAFWRHPEGFPQSDGPLGQQFLRRMGELLEPVSGHPDPGVDLREQLAGGGGDGPLGVQGQPVDEAAVVGLTGLAAHPRAQPGDGG